MEISRQARNDKIGCHYDQRGGNYIKHYKIFV